MEQYEPPKKSIKVIRSQPKKGLYNFIKNKLYLSIALLCFIVAGCVIIIHYVDGPPASAIAGVEGVPSATPLAFETDALAGRLIVVDAGHGGFDPGASGADGTREDELNLQVAKYMKEDMEACGAKVIMTRSNANALADTKEEDMAERRRIITESQSDIVVSIHMNSYTDSSVSGPLVLFMEGSTRGEKLAKSIQKSLIDLLLPDQENSARYGDLYILRSGSQPCVIVECGYLSNEKEAKMLMTSDYQKKLSQAICEGVIIYFSSGEE